MKAKIIIIGLFISILLGHNIFGQVTIDATSMGFTGNADNFITVSHTTGNQQNRLMLVGVSFRENQTLSATYDGVDMTLVGVETNGINARTAIFSLLDPSAGTNNVIVTTTGDFDQGGIVGVMTFYGVDPVTPLNTYASNFGSSGDPTLSNIATSSNQIIFGVVGFQNGELTGPGASETQQWYQASGDDMRGGGSTKPGSISQPGTMTWSRTLTNDEDWSMSAVSIRPIPNSDLSVTKTVNNSTPYKGQTITFTLTASNTGATVDNINVDDILPSGYDYVSHSTATGTYNAGTGLWDIGTLNSGASGTLTINAVVLATGTYLNTATISGNVNDTNAGNDTATRTITICQAGGNQPLFGN